jgi:hypothetical protein
MSAFGPFASALHMSAFGCKADMGKLYSTPGKSGHRARHRSLNIEYRLLLRAVGGQFIELIDKFAIAATLIDQLR